MHLKNYVLNNTCIFTASYCIGAHYQDFKRGSSVDVLDWFQELSLSSLRSPETLVSRDTAHNFVRLELRHIVPVPPDIQ